MQIIGIQLQIQLTVFMLVHMVETPQHKVSVTWI